MNKKKLLEIEDLLIDAFNNKTNVLPSDYDKVKRNLQINKSKNSFFWSKIALLSTSLAAILLILFIFIFINEDDNSDKTNNPINDNHFNNNYENDDIESKKRLVIEKLNYNGSESISNNYYLEILFSYSPHINGIVDEAYYKEMNSLLLEKLVIPEEIEFNISNDSKSVYCYLTSDEYLKLKNNNLKQYMSKWSSYDFVFDVILYDEDNSETKLYYKKNNYITSDMIEITDRFFNKDNEVILSIDFTSKQEVNDNSSEENDSFYESNSNILSQLEFNKDSYKDVVISDSSPSISISFSNYSEYLNGKNQFQSMSNSAVVDKIVVNLVDSNIDVSKLNLPTKNDAFKVEIGMLLSDVEKILGQGDVYKPNTIQNNSKSIKYLLNDGSYIIINYAFENSDFVVSIIDWSDINENE